MKSYESYVKELVMLFSMKGTRNFHQTLSGVLNLVDAENKIEITKLASKGEKKIFPHSRRGLEYALYESLIDRDKEEGATGEVFVKIYEIFEVSSLKIKHLPNFETSLEKIAEFFGLDEVSKRALAFLFILSVEKGLEDMIGEYHWRDELLKNHEILTEDRDKAYAALSAKGYLVSCGIISFWIRGIKISTHISESLMSPLIDFEDKIVGPPPGEPLPLEYFQLSTNRISYLSTLLQNSRGINILLTGEPGVGKTSLAHSLLTSLGIPCIYLKNDIDESEDRKVTLYAARRLAQRTGKVLIVDEADDLLQKTDHFFAQSKVDGKSWANMFLDSCEDARIIWITNKNKLCESTARRFNYIVNFPALSQKQRTAIWKNVILKHEQEWILENPKFPSMVSRFVLDAGSINDCMHRMKELGSKDINFAIHYLEQKMEFMKGGKGKMDVLGESYSLDALNMSVSPDKVMKHLQLFIERPSNDQSYNILLHGVSGAGKTQFVKYLGHTLDKEVITMSVSNLVSKYVGETEANIAKSFAAAKASGAILFYDEADSFFQSRETAERQYERNQVNELLIQMNNFHGGVFIASTNFMNLDSASMRRFQSKIKFDFLKTDGIELLFKSYFPERDFVNELNEMKNLTPGDFKNVAQRLSYEDSFSNEDILREFREEVSYKSPKPRVQLIH